MLWHAGKPGMPGFDRIFPEFIGIKEKNAYARIHA